MKDYDKMYKIAEILKERFNNITTLELLDIARKILKAFEENQ